MMKSIFKSVIALVLTGSLAVPMIGNGLVSRVYSETVVAAPAAMDVNEEYRNEIVEASMDGGAKVTTVDSVEAFSDAVLAIAGRYNSVNEGYEDESSRLIVTASVKDFDTLDAIEVIAGYGDYYLLQFASVKDAKEAAEYYASLNCVNTVEEDSLIFADDYTNELVNVAEDCVRIKANSKIGNFETLTYASQWNYHVYSLEVVAGQTFFYTGSCVYDCLYGIYDAEMNLVESVVPRKNSLSDYKFVIPANGSYLYIVSKPDFTLLTYSTEEESTETLVEDVTAACQKFAANKKISDFASLSLSAQYYYSVYTIEVDPSATYFLSGTILFDGVYGIYDKDYKLLRCLYISGGDVNDLKIKLPGDAKYMFFTTKEGFSLTKVTNAMTATKEDGDVSGDCIKFKANSRIDNFEAFSLASQWNYHIYQLEVTAGQTYVYSGNCLYNSLYAVYDADMNLLTYYGAKATTVADYSFTMPENAAYLYLTCKPDFHLVLKGSAETPNKEVVTEAPTTAPVKDETTAAPTKEEQTTQAPTTQAPTTQAPTTQAPTTQAPTTQVPTTQAPSKAPETEAATTAYNMTYTSWGYANASTNKYALNLNEFMNAYADKMKNQVVVAVLDTGIRATHERFLDANGKSRILTKGYDTSSNATATSFLTDDYGHGTHVAGIIAEATPDNVKIMSVKVMENGRGYLSWTVAGVEYAVNAKVNVMNMSLSGVGTSTTLNTLFKKFYQNGGIAVASSGNSYRISSEYYPANCDYVVTVAAMDQTGNVTNYSNYGANVEILAPGENIVSSAYSSNTATVSKRGTSQAAPHVAAVAALFKSYNNRIGYDQFLSIIAKTCNTYSYVKDSTTYTLYRLTLGADSLAGY